MQNVIIWGLAVFWISNTLARYDGPDDKLKTFREYLETKYGSYSPLHCSYCSSFWILLLFGLFFYLIPVLLYFFAVLGVAAVARGISLEL